MGDLGPYELQAAPASPSPSPSQLRGHNDVSRLVLDLHLTLKLVPAPVSGERHGTFPHRGMRMSHLAAGSQAH